MNDGSAASEVPQITVAELHVWLQNAPSDPDDASAVEVARPLLLDVREAQEWVVARLPGARLAPLSDLAERGRDALPAELVPETPVVVYCHHGVRSARVAAWLKQQGYHHVFNLAGGIDAWSLQVDASVPRY